MNRIKHIYHRMEQVDRELIVIWALLLVVTQLPWLLISGPA